MKQFLKKHRDDRLLSINGKPITEIHDFGAFSGETTVVMVAKDGTVTEVVMMIEKSN